MRLNYVYIENQNFTTASLDRTDTIPRAIADRIIKADVEGHFFYVYLTLPRYPVLETDELDNMQVKYLAMSQKDTIEALFSFLKSQGIEDPSKYLTISTQVKSE